MTKLNKVVLENVVVEKKIDNRTNNPGRPVNKQSARYKRLAKQAFYASVNSKFKKGSQFKVDGSSSRYKYSVDNDGGLGCIVETVLVTALVISGNNARYSSNVETESTQTI